MNIIEKLRALREKAEWDDQDRLALVVGLSSFMQEIYGGGVPYGYPGIPNMQTLIEVGFLGYEDDSQEYLDSQRQELLTFVEVELLPFLVRRDTGYIPISASVEDLGGRNSYGGYVGKGLGLLVLALLAYRLGGHIGRLVMNARAGA